MSTQRQEHIRKRTKSINIINGLLTSFAPSVWESICYENLRQINTVFQYIQNLHSFNKHLVYLTYILYDILIILCLKVYISFPDESSIGVLYSKERNVGKSLTLKSLAKGQGIVSCAHPLFCSGSDQTISGVSLWVYSIWAKCTGMCAVGTLTL